MSEPGAIQSTYRSNGVVEVAGLLYRSGLVGQPVAAVQLTPSLTPSFTP